MAGNTTTSNRSYFGYLSDAPFAAVSHGGVSFGALSAVSKTIGHAHSGFEHQTPYVGGTSSVQHTQSGYHKTQEYHNEDIDPNGGIPCDVAVSFFYTCGKDASRVLCAL